MCELRSYLRKFDEPKLSKINLQTYIVGIWDIENFDDEFGLIFNIRHEFDIKNIQSVKSFIFIFLTSYPNTSWYNFDFFIIHSQQHTLLICYTSHLFSFLYSANLH